MFIIPMTFAGVALIRLLPETKGRSVQVQFLLSQWRV